MTGMNKYQQIFANFSELWMIDNNPQDAWFSHFDWLTQYELSRNLLAFKNKKWPWVFSAPKYVPATLMCIADFQQEDKSIERLQDTWKKIGAPKTLVFNTDKPEFVKKLITCAPQKFMYIREHP